MAPNKSTAMSHKTEFTTPSDREVAAIRRFDAPRELVWDCFTRPEHIRRWMTGPDGWSMPECHVDLRVGGKWHFVWQKEGGERMEMTGEYREVNRPEKLVHTESWGDPWPETINTTVFTDENGDGRHDKRTVFYDKLNYVTGIEVGYGGAWVMSPPYFYFIPDRDGDLVPDGEPEVLLDGFGNHANAHNLANGFAWGLDGWLYGTHGRTNWSLVGKPGTPDEDRLRFDGGVYRYEPRTHKFSAYVTTRFANPHGHVWDRWGQDIVYDGTGANPYHGALFSSHLEYPDKHPKPPQVYQQRTRPCSGLEYLSSSHFPDEMQGNLLVPNVIGIQGILRYKVIDKDSSFGAEEQEPIVLSSDPNFRPTDAEIGGDGAIYFGDWQNPIIGHMQHNLRDPSRDKQHGRVYRVTYNGRPLLKPLDMTKLSVDQLVAAARAGRDKRAPK